LQKILPSIFSDLISEKIKEGMSTNIGITHTRPFQKFRDFLNVIYLTEYCILVLVGLGAFGGENLFGSEPIQEEWIHAE